MSGYNGEDERKSHLLEVVEASLGKELWMH